MTRPELDQLRAVLQRSTVGVIVTGMRGVGKTQLAAALVREHLDTDLALIGWVNAETLDTTHAGLADIAEHLGVADLNGDSANSARRLRNHLSSRTEAGLLVFDNALDPDLLRPLLPVGGTTQVVITSTNKTFTALGEPVQLDVYTDQQAINYLHEATGLTDRDNASRLAAALGNLPVALSAAAATIAGRHLDFLQYLKLLEQSQLPEVLERKAGHDYPRSVAQALLLSIDTVEAPNEISALNITVRWLLGAIAMLSHAGVRRAILPDHDEEIDKSVERCVDGSLLSWSTTGDTLIMHRLIARILRERAQSTNTTTELITNALAIVEPHLFDPSEAWTRREQGIHLVDHIDAIWDAQLLTTTNLPLTERALRTRAWAVRQLVESADLARSLTLGPLTLIDCERLLGPDHPETLTSRSNLARAYESAGQPFKAITFFEATLTDRERILGTGHPQTRNTRNNLAGAYRAAGRLDEAIILHESNLADREHIIGADHPETLTSRNNLAYAYKAADRLDEAIILYEVNLADRERILGPDHPKTLISRNNLADAYESAGRLDEAITLHESNVTDRERILGPDHPKTLTSRNNLAHAYKAAGRLDEAITLYEVNLADRERILGTDHPHTLTSRNNLADAYESAGRLNEAIILFEATLADRERILGPDHHETLTSRNQLARARDAHNAKG
ncbi:FxSxx-COOH system tetratricopeptide repeat protein [Nocardia sp. XZ_19_369]|uniref:FxSxx-COOH system tetratricopeptide repeat protein n=1 Tax=Nocardia sp. XZ_19_369 TaxID=2769487 RepID=UPI00188DC756|nr:FxSxx-COOH system tetratricopeptide repeat protein [Nocardia sp. XZ_19_369]